MRTELTAVIPFAKIGCSSFILGASCRIRTNDPEITNHVLWPTELKRRHFCFAGAKVGKTFKLANTLKKNAS